MYAGVADIAGGIIFTDGTDLTDTASLSATPSSISTATGWRASATTARCSVRSRARRPMARTTSGRPRSPSAATTATGAAGPWAISRMLAAASVYNTDDDNVDYAYAASASFLHDPTGLSLTLSTGGQKLDEGDDPSNLYGKIGWDTEFWPVGPTGFGIDYTQGREHQQRGRRGHLLRPRRGPADRALRDRPLQPTALVRARHRRRARPEGRRRRHLRHEVHFLTTMHHLIAGDRQAAPGSLRYTTAQVWVPPISRAHHEASLQPIDPVVVPLLPAVRQVVSGYRPRPPPPEASASSTETSASSRRTRRAIEASRWTARPIGREPGGGHGRSGRSTSGGRSLSGRSTSTSMSSWVS